MPDVLDDATLGVIRALVGTVNANTLILPGRHGGPLHFTPGELFCYDVSWICGEPIHGSCWYDPDGFGLKAIALEPGRWPPRDIVERKIPQRRAHFPDHVVWKVNLAPVPAGVETP